ncbi:MAG: sulfatase-like hydrolase/transferase [bacterium]|nr:sulfatase-like hydrolase/transferase [bacterium]
MRFLIYCFACTIFLAAQPWTIAQSPVRPNILYFYVDDMGWGAIGPNGQSARQSAGQAFVRTPNINELARRGINFTRGYGCHVCSPARSSQQSGFHQGHTFADRNDPDNARKAMRADEILIGDALSAAGYTTGYWGKWGYGGSKDRIQPVIENVQTLPTSHGYQHVLAELHHVRAHTFFQPTLWQAPASDNRLGGLQLVPNTLAAYQRNAAYPNSPALQNHDNYPATAYCDDAYAFAALDFVRRHGQQYHATGKPFFGLLAVQIPHAPFDEITKLPEWDRAYAGDALMASLSDQTRQWAAMVTRIDEHFGNILAALEDPNNDGDPADSILNDTLVIFQSDNGGPAGPSHRELDTNGGLRGTKGTIQEGGIRVPLVMAWPGQITARSQLKAGTNCDRVVDVSDLLPTFCELAGAPIPLGIDGVSIAPSLSGKGVQRRRDFIIHEASNGQSIIRANWKLIRTGKGELELYDLASDHSESKDVAPDHPDKVREMEQLLLAERVTEPKGFAITYHHWNGDDGASVQNPDHWSDYEYSNNGISYLRDDGGPRLSWIASMINHGHQANTAIADGNTEFLGLEIAGNASSNSPQRLLVGAAANLTGRNEIRVSSLGILSLQGGCASSLRWIDIQSGGKLAGHGTLQGAVYNQGSLAISGPTNSGIRVDGDFRQAADGQLSIELQRSEHVPFHISGTAILDGQLKISCPQDLPTPADRPYTILSATQVTGRFQHANDQVRSEDGKTFTIRYFDNKVSLIPE